MRDFLFFRALTVLEVVSTNVNVWCLNKVLIHSNKQPLCKRGYAKDLQTSSERGNKVQPIIIRAQQNEKKGHTVKHHRVSPSVASRHKSPTRLHHTVKHHRVSRRPRTEKQKIFWKKKTCHLALPILDQRPKQSCRCGAVRLPQLRDEQNARMHECSKAQHTVKHHRVSLGHPRFFRRADWLWRLLWPLCVTSGSMAESGVATKKNEDKRCVLFECPGPRM